MSRAVIFGAGSIGRGFIGASLSEAGWEVTFVDVAEALVQQLNADGYYRQVIVSNEGEEAHRIGPVSAVLPGSEALVLALREADLVATAVGAANLVPVAKALAVEASRRCRESLPQLDVLVCENLHDAPEVLRSMIAEQSSTQIASTVGLAGTSIGRMVPVAVPPTSLGRGSTPTSSDATSVRVEPYSFLPYDASALRSRPQAPDLIPVTDGFAFYEDRKLLVHNMGHCLLAYLGEVCGHEYTWQAMEDPEIRLLVRGAMTESSAAVSSKHHRPIGPVLEHVSDLLTRFGNRPLGDTVERVGRDPQRKMRHDDRLLGAFLACTEAGVVPVHILVAVALGARRLAREDGWNLDTAIAHVEDHLFIDDAEGLEPLFRELLDIDDVGQIIQTLDAHYVPSRIV